MAVKKVGEKYRCNVCGNEVTVTKVGGGTLVCCGQDMELISSQGFKRSEQMENEQARTLEVLQLAVQMEVEGKEFYQKASQKSSNKLAKELFQQLANEEDVHRKKFEEIYEALSRGQNWPDVGAPSEKGKRLKSLFAEATKALGSKIKVAESELEAIKIAMDMEIKSYNLYHSRSEEITLPVEKRFYETLAGEEREHHLALLDSYEYLSDPAGWFTKSEHWSLDGA